MTDNNKKPAEDAERIGALAEWRKKHWHNILTKNKQELESIRDDPDAKHRDKIEACKLLARMVDAVSPERVSAGTIKKKGDEDWWTKDLESEDQVEIESIVNPAK